MRPGPWSFREANRGTRRSAPWNKRSPKPPLQMDGVKVLVIPHLYDLPKASDSYKKLSDIEGDLIVVSWIYSRAAHWVLDRNGIQGQVGEVELGGAADEEQDDDARDDGTGNQAESSEQRDVDRVTDLHPRPDRNIHCIDLKVSDRADAFVDEIRRIVGVEPNIRDTSLPIVGGETGSS